MVSGVSTAVGTSPIDVTLSDVAVGPVSTVIAFVAVNVPASSVIVRVAGPAVAVAAVA